MGPTLDIGALELTLDADRCPAAILPKALPRLLGLSSSSTRLMVGTITILICQQGGPPYPQVELSTLIVWALLILGQGF